MRTGSLERDRSQDSQEGLEREAGGARVRDEGCDGDVNDGKDAS